MKKYLPHILIGVPLLIGAVIAFAYVRKAKKMKDDETKPTPEPEVKIRTGGGGTTTPTRTKTDDEIPLRKGSKGKYVQEVQKALGITADGDFGNITDRTVRDYQKRMNLQVDGIVGKITWKSLFATEFPNTSPRKPMSPISGTDVLSIKASPTKQPFGKTGLTGTGVTAI